MTTYNELRAMAQEADVCVGAVQANEFVGGVAWAQMYFEWELEDGEPVRMTAAALATAPPEVQRKLVVHAALKACKAAADYAAQKNEYDTAEDDD